MSSPSLIPSSAHKFHVTRHHLRQYPITTTNPSTTPITTTTKSFLSSTSISSSPNISNRIVSSDEVFAPVYPPGLNEDCKSNPISCATSFIGHHPSASFSSQYPSGVSTPAPSQGGIVSSTLTGDSVTATFSPTSTGVPDVIVNSDSTWTPGAIAGIVVGCTLGAVGLGVFFWLLRRGTFGSGTLFGFKYGHARYDAASQPSQGQGAGVSAEMTQRRQKEESGFILSATPFDPSASHPTLPLYPASTVSASPNAKLQSYTPPSSSSSSSSPRLQHITSSLNLTDPHQHLPPPSPHAHPPRYRSPITKPPPSPTSASWSTSPSAFDHAYGIRAGSVISSAYRSSASAPSVSDADAATLVSQPTGTSAMSDPFRPESAFSHPPPSTSSVSSTSSSAVARHISHTHSSDPPMHEHPHYLHHDTSAHTQESGLGYASVLNATRRLSAIPQRLHSPNPTVGSVSPSMVSVRTGTSSIDGVRISSWHSSDSEETELLGRGRR